MKKFDNTRPATLAELKAAFPGDAAYVLEAAQARKTMLLAKADYGDVLAERPEPARNADIGPLGGRGSAVISSGRSIRPAAQTYDSGDGAADFEQAVEDEMKKQGAGVNRKKAVAAVCKKRPDLHRAYLERNNPGRRERALIAQKYDRDEE